MNIAFFLLPKSEVVCINAASTVRQTLEKMEHHRYTAVPVIDENGRYIKTITEGDLLWRIKNTEGLTFQTSNHHYIKDMKVNRDYQPVHIDAEMEDLMTLVEVQNFVPVVDDNEVFIGIIRRMDIIQYLRKMTT
ncbi:CBS domain-containing protein [Fictibacillus nanhaiensis]|uniref:CBS domain-containing protein n=1 Tax=Fictibacillus nanhaiensis TaxID=742169 RepID=A0ABS2ZRD1_9BACL|nr:CBS domain-containing protein [Fictibacillus nanhaiensis]